MLECVGIPFFFFSNAMRSCLCMFMYIYVQAYVYVEVCVDGGGGGQTMACVSPLCILPRLWVELWKSAWRSSSQWPERSQSRRTQTEVLREPQIPASSETSNPLFSCPNSKAIKLSWQPFRKQWRKPHPDPPPHPHLSTPVTTLHPPSYTSTRDIRDLPPHFLNKDLTS